MKKDTVSPQECPNCQNPLIIHVGDGWILYAPNSMEGYEYDQEITYCPYCGVKLPKI